MKMFKKLALITLVSTAVFQAQAISFNEIVEIAKENPKTAVAIYAVGVMFNFCKIHPARQARGVTQVKQNGITITTIDDSNSYSLVQKAGCLLLPYLYGFIDPVKSTLPKTEL